MPLSDMIGRAYEFKITKAIQKELKKHFENRVRLTQRAKEAQEYGFTLFRELNSAQKNQFELAGKKIAKWLGKNKFTKIEKKMKFEKKPDRITGYLFEKTESKRIGIVEIDRIPDMAGTRSDVTDIRITFQMNNKTSILNISLKHRHEALKHPRLTRVPNWIDLANTPEGRLYLKKYKEIWKSFFEKCNETSPDSERFREIKAIDNNFIERELYQPLYKLVRSFLKQNIRNSSQVQTMFDFMVGKFDYIKFVDYDNKIEVMDFSDIKKPNSVEVEYAEGGYLYLNFDNKWKISGRLHTATQWLRESIKFDMKPCNLDQVIPKTII